MIALEDLPVTCLDTTKYVYMDHLDFIILEDLLTKTSQLQEINRNTISIEETLLLSGT